MSSDASTRGWGPGWPNPDTSKIVELDLPGYGTAQRVRLEIKPLVEWLITETNRRGYTITPYGTWGFDNRAIRGTKNTPSNHSWGLALDLNAPRNGLNHAGPGWQIQHDTRHTDMPKWVPELWESYGFRWGGNYGPMGKRQDPMHMEFMGTPSDAARYTAQITAPPEPKGPLMALSDDEQTEILTKTRDLHDAFIGDGKKPAKGAWRALLGKLDRRTADLVTGKRPTKG